MAYTFAGAIAYGVHRGQRFSRLRRALKAARPRRCLRILARVLASAALVISALTFAGVLHADGFGDYAVGSNTAYCGVYFSPSHALSFYCQSGH